MLVAVALANKIARIAWALMAKGGIYRSLAAALKGADGGSRVDVVGSTEDYGQTVRRRDRANQHTAERL